MAISEKDDFVIFIRVIQGRNMPKMDSVGWCDPYFVIKFGAQSKQTTVQKNTKTPTYDESFSFKRSTSNTNFVEISCFDWDRMSSNEVIGAFMILIEEFESKPVRKWFNVDGKDQNKGEVELEIVRKPADYKLKQLFDVNLEQIVVNQNVTEPPLEDGEGEKGEKDAKKKQPPPAPPPSRSRSGVRASISTARHNITHAFGSIISTVKDKGSKLGSKLGSGSSRGSSSALNETGAGGGGSALAVAKGGPASELFLDLVDGVLEMDEVVDMYGKRLAATPLPYPVYWFPIPKVMVVLAVRILQHSGLTAEGIFRKSINRELLDELVETANNGRASEITVTDCHAYAVLLKTWLRRLEDRVVPPSIYRLALAFGTENVTDDAVESQPTYSNDDVFAYHNTNDGTSVSTFTEFINQHLSPVVNLSLKYLIRFLRIFPVDPYVKTNLMDLTNITKLMAPNILIAKNDDTREISDALADTPLEIKFTAGLFRTVCITASEETLFESLDASVRRELGVPEETVLPVLQYYARGKK